MCAHKQMLYSTFIGRSVGEGRGELRGACSPFLGQDAPHMIGVITNRTGIRSHFFEGRGGGKSLNLHFAP